MILPSSGEVIHGRNNLEEQIILSDLGFLPPPPELGALKVVVAFTGWGERRGKRKCGLHQSSGCVCRGLSVSCPRRSSGSGSQSPEHITKAIGENDDIRTSFFLREN